MLTISSLSLPLRVCLSFASKSLRHGQVLRIWLVESLDVGAGLGTRVGASCVGACVGASVGAWLGLMVGTGVSTRVGALVGTGVVGTFVGPCLEY
jgi:hypothetical protein